MNAASLAMKIDPPWAAARTRARVAPAAGLFGYTRDDLVRARCPYAADPQKFAEFFVETCSCALHRALRIALPARD